MANDNLNNLLRNLVDAASKASALTDRAGKLWTPNPGPQEQAFNCDADVIGFGGAAGGSKTELGIGKALLKGQRVAIFRRHATELTAIIDRIGEIIGHREGLNQVQGIWRLPEGRVIEFGSVPNLGDERKYQGRPKDLLVIDEAANFIESQVRFLAGWLRSTDPNQKCQLLLTFNPPTTAEGRWVISYFAPWLDRKHPNPAVSGEIRYFAMIDGKEVEVETGEPFEHGGETIRPQSRTFIASRLADNPYLAGTNYLATLQALPEPLRSQMLHGDFEAGLEDAADQVIPTAWVEAAMARWKRPDKLPPMTALGADIARGGRDNTVLSRRHGNWFDELLTYPGSETPDGPTAAGRILAASRNRCNLYVDVIGVGGSVYDFLMDARQPVYGINVSEAATGTDKSGRLRFANLRSQTWWAMREALDPAANTGIALPPDRRLLADLCAPTWELRSNGVIQVESRDAIVKRIGRSPDFASAVILALRDEPSLEDLTIMVERQREINRRAADYDPMAALDRGRGQTLEYDPFAYRR